MHKVTLFYTDRWCHVLKCFFIFPPTFFFYICGGSILRVACGRLLVLLLMQNVCTRLIRCIDKATPVVDVADMLFRSFSRISSVVASWGVFLSLFSETVVPEPCPTSVSQLPPCHARSSCVRAIVSGSELQWSLSDVCKLISKTC